jgi:hypothetical protein
MASLSLFNTASAEDDVSTPILYENSCGALHDQKDYIIKALIPWNTVVTVGLCIARCTAGFVQPVMCYSCCLAK